MYVSVVNRYINHCDYLTITLVSSCFFFFFFVGLVSKLPLYKILDIISKVAK